MDALQRTGTAGNLYSSSPASSYKAPAQEAAPGDLFAPSVSTSIPTRPAFSTDTRSVGAGELSAMSWPSIEATTAAATPGVQMFGSISGAIAQLLISTEQEIELGKMMTEQVESTMKLSSDPELQARVENIGTQLAAQSSREGIPYTFKVVEDDTINAFACPGGSIYVHSGLLKSMPDDKELTFVLAHEVAHVEHRDSIDKLGLTLLQNILQTALGTTPWKLDDLLGAAIGNLYDSALSRKAEYAADARGAEHLTKLGISPKEGAEALRRLKAEGEGAPNLLEKLIATHPPLEERALKLEKMGV